MDRNKSAWGQGPKAGSITTTNGAGRGGDVLKRQPKDRFTQNMARKPSSDGNVGQRRGNSDFSEEVRCLPLFNSMVTAAVGCDFDWSWPSAPLHFCPAIIFLPMLWHCKCAPALLVLCRVYGSLFTSYLMLCNAPYVSVRRVLPN